MHGVVPCRRQWLHGSIIVLSATHHAADDDGVLLLEPRRRTNRRTDGRLRCDDDDNGQRRRNEGPLAGWLAPRRERRKQYRTATENNKNLTTVGPLAQRKSTPNHACCCRTREYVPTTLSIRPVSAVVMLFFDCMGTYCTCPGTCATTGANVVLPANFQDYIRLYRPTITAE